MACLDQASPDKEGSSVSPCVDSKCPSSCLLEESPLTAGVLMDSFDIAQWADKHGKDNAGKKLFPDGQLQVISKYDTPSTCILVLHRHSVPCCKHTTQLMAS